MQQLFQPALCKKSHAQLSPYIWFLVKLVDLTFNPLAQYFLSASSKISILVHLGKWKNVLLKEWVVHRDFLPETTVQKEGGGKKKFTWRNLTNSISATWSRSTSRVKMLDRMKWKWYFTSVVFLLKTPNYSLILRKTSDKFQYKCILLCDQCFSKWWRSLKKKNGGEGEEFE